METIDVSDSRLRASLGEAAKWCNRLAILQYVFAAFMGLISLAALANMLLVGFPTEIIPGDVGIAGFFIPLVILMLLITAFYVFLARKLQGFANAFMVSAGQVLTNDRLERGFREFGTLFKVSVLAVVIFFVLGTVLSVGLASAVLALGGASG